MPSWRDRPAAEKQALLEKARLRVAAARALRALEQEELVPYASADALIAAAKARILICDPGPHSC